MLIFDRPLLSSTFHDDRRRVASSCVWLRKTPYTSSSDSNNWSRLYISIKVIFWYSIMVKWKISYFDPWLVNKWRYEPHRRVQRNWEKNPPLVFSPLVFFLIRNAVSVEDGGSYECFTFGTKNVGSVEFHKEKRIIFRRA